MKEKKMYEKQRERDKRYIRRQNKPEVKNIVTTQKAR